ncbi:MAG TPA: hypothetical protein VGH99_10455 [Pseudonocardia sp.]
MPDLRRRIHAEHVSDGAGYCRDCQSARWPCELVQLAAEADRQGGRQPHRSSRPPSTSARTLGWPVPAQGGAGALSWPAARTAAIGAHAPAAAYAPAAQVGGYPGAEYGHWSTTDSGAYPAAAGYGDHPGGARTGGYPAVGGPGGYPPVTRSGAYPAVGGPGGNPVAGPVGAHPAVTQVGPHPLADRRPVGSAPADPTGGLPEPRRNLTGQFPAVDHNAEGHNAEGHDGQRAAEQGMVEDPAALAYRDELAARRDQLRGRPAGQRELRNETRARREQRRAQLNDSGPRTDALGRHDFGREPGPGDDRPASGPPPGRHDYDTLAEVLSTRRDGPSWPDRS